MTAATCPSPETCPVPAPETVDLRRLRLRTWQDGRLYRVHVRGYEPAALVPSGAGKGRFSPLPGVDHTYVAGSGTAALLESVLHEAFPPAAIYRATLARWAISEVTVAQALRLIDLRDEALSNLGLERRQLVASTPAHYPCTRQWAATLAPRGIGGRAVDGLVWHSRQAEAWRAADRSPLLSDLLQHRALEVAVLWRGSRQPSPLHAAGRPQPLDDGDGLRLVMDLANLIGAPIL